MNTWALKTPAALLKADGVMFGSPGFECIGSLLSSFTKLLLSPRAGAAGVGHNARLHVTMADCSSNTPQTSAAQIGFLTLPCNRKTQKIPCTGFAELLNKLAQRN